LCFGMALPPIEVLTAIKSNILLQNSCLIFGECLKYNEAKHGAEPSIIKPVFLNFSNDNESYCSEIVIDGDDCVERTASPFFFCRILRTQHIFQSPGICFGEVGVMLNFPMN